MRIPRYFLPFFLIMMDATVKMTIRITTKIIVEIVCVLMGRPPFVEVDVFMFLNYRYKEFNNRLCNTKQNISDIWPSAVQMGHKY